MYIAIKHYRFNFEQARTLVLNNRNASLKVDLVYCMSRLFEIERGEYYKHLL